MKNNPALLGILVFSCVITKACAIFLIQFSERPASYIFCENFFANVLFLKFNVFDQRV